MLELILLQVITFAVVIAVLHFLFGSQLKVALNRLQVLHQESLEKEEILNKELERAKVQVDAEIARSKEEAKRIIESAKQSAERVGREAAERAQAEAKKMIDEAQERTKRLESEVLASVDEKAVGLSQELIRYTFSQEDQKVLQVHLIDELIEELKKIDKARLAVQAEHAEVLASRPLTLKEKQDLREVLVAKLGREISVEEKSDPSLIFGIVIKLGGLVVDGSLKNKLARAVQAMRSKKI